MISCDECLSKTLKDTNNELLPGDKMNVGSLSDWFHFKKMLTPLIIKIIYVLSNVIILLFAVLMMLTGAAALFNQNLTIGIISFLLITIVTLLFTVFGVLMIRLLCECIMVIFGIHESLVAIEKKLVSEKK